MKLAIRKAPKNALGFPMAHCNPRFNPSEPGAFNLRGRTTSDGEGRYHFESIVPGRYPLFWPLT